MINDVYFSYNIYIASSFIENDVLRRLKQYKLSFNIIKVWKIYWDEIWIKNVRDKVLSWDENQDWIIKCIMTALREIRNKWKILLRKII